MAFCMKFFFHSFVENIVMYIGIVIKEIRKHNKYENLKIYALTAYAMLSDKEIMEKNGFDGLITKRINTDQLERKLNDVFKKA